MARQALFSFCVELFLFKKGTGMDIKRAWGENGRLEYTGGILELFHSGLLNILYV